MLSYGYRFLVIAMMLVLIGCSSLTGKEKLIKDRDNEYREAQTMPSLVVPSHLKATTLNTDYAIPETRANTPSTQSVELLPPGSLVEQLAHKKTSSDKKSS